MSEHNRDEEHPSDPPPASARVLRVRRIDDAYGVFGGDTEVGERHATREAAIAAARELAGGRGALILVEGDNGLEAEAVPPSSTD